MNPIPDPHWTAYLTAIATPIIAVTAAVIAGVFAYRNWRTAQNKLKLDLFDRRMVAYEKIKSFYGAAYQGEWDAEGSNTYEKFLYVRREASWIFSDEITKWIDCELSEKFKEYSIAVNELLDEDDPEKQKEIRKRSNAVLKWLAENEKEVQKMFGKDLKLKT